MCGDGFRSCRFHGHIVAYRGDWGMVESSYPGLIVEGGGVEFDRIANTGTVGIYKFRSND